VQGEQELDGQVEVLVRKLVQLLGMQELQAYFVLLELCGEEELV